MSNLLVISVAPCDTRVALVEDGRLAEFSVETRGDNGLVGNIYKGRVVKLLPGMAAAFVDAGLSRPAYLFAEDVIPQEDEFFDLWLKGEIEETPDPRRRPPPATIGDLLHEGQEVLVQVIRGPSPAKGARLTTHVSLAGHFLVYMPTLAQLGISRRIVDEAERKRIKALLEEVKPPEGGLIARTAARGQDLEKLARERDLLLTAWQRLLRRKDSAPCPGLLHQEMEATRRVVRELLTPEVDRVVVDDAAAFEQILAYLEAVNPGDKYRLELYEGPESIFSHFGLEMDWAKLLAPKVWLKSGGYLFIDRTEALTAIDVNTGRFVGRQHLEETIFQTNLEAAREIARQLRLRNIGGLIVIDFIDQEKATHREHVYQALVRALAQDRAKSVALPISQLGLVEMTRQRLRNSLAQTVTEACTGCGGRGEVLAPSILVCDLLRHLTNEAREFAGGRLKVEAHPELVQLLRRDAGPVLANLAAAHQVQVTFAEDSSLARDHFEISREWGK